MEAASMTDPVTQDPEAPVAPVAVEHIASTKAGELQVLRIDDLQIDHAYQRELSNDLVDRIAKKWDIAIAGPISISRRANGTLWIIDGGHRAAAAKIAGEQEILARVFVGLTSQQEASFRLAGNIRRSDKPYERFRAQLAAGDTESLAIQEVLAQFDTQINPYPHPRHGVNSVSAVETLYRRDNGILLTRTLEVIKDAWGEVGGDTATVAVLKSIAFFLERHSDEMSRPRLIDRLQSVGVNHLGQRAVNHRALVGGAMWVNLYRAIIEVYNDRLSQANKLELRLGKVSGFDGDNSSTTLKKGG